jgi:hypothetical protein
LIKKNDEFLIISTINYNDPVTYLWTNVYLKLDQPPSEQEIHTVLANVTKHPLSGELNGQLIREALLCMPDVVLDDESLGVDSPFIGHIKGSAFNWFSGFKLDKPQFLDYFFDELPSPFDSEDVQKIWNLPSQACREDALTKENCEGLIDALKNKAFIKEKIVKNCEALVKFTTDLHPLPTHSQQ